MRSTHARFLVSMLAVLSLMLLSGSALAQEPVTINFSFGTDRFGVVQEIIEDFEAENPGIKVNLMERPEGSQNVYDYYVTMWAARDSTIDVVSIDVIWPASFVAAGWLEPLDKWFTAAEQKQYLPAMIDAMTVNGHIYGIPWMNDIGMLYYRTDLLDQAGMAGPPETWAELAAQAGKLQTDQVSGFVSSWGRTEQLTCNVLEYVYGNNGYFISDDGQVGINRPKAVEAVEWMRTMLKDRAIMPGGVLTYTTDESRQAFTEGRAAFHRNWNYVWALSQAPGSKVRGNVEVTKIPKFEGGTHVTSLGGWNYAVSAFSNRKPEAIKFIKYIGSPDSQARMFIEGEYLPAALPAYQNPEVSVKYPKALQVVDIAMGAIPRPASPRYRELTDILQSQIHEVLTAGRDVKAALDRVARSWQSML